MGDKEFLSLLRHQIPEAEDFLLETLNKELLSEESKSILYGIQDKLICLRHSSSQSSDQIIDLDNCAIISPPAEFKDDVPCNDSDSQSSEFILQFDSDSTHNSQTTPPCTYVNNNKILPINKKRQETLDSLGVTPKKIKLSSTAVTSSDEEDISYSPIELKEPFEGVLDYITPPIQFNQSPEHSVSSENEYRSSSSTSSSSSSSSESQEIKNAENADVVDLYVSHDEAFPSSDNNTPESMTAQPCEVYSDIVEEKRSVKSRLGVRQEISDTPQSDGIEIRPTKFKVKFDRVIQHSMERPIKCNDCRADIPVVREQFKCRHCYYKYAKQTEFENHVTERGEMSCIICKITFNTECELNLHMVRHPKVKLCEPCRSVRRQKSVDKSVQLDPLHSVDGSYFCKICSMRFQTKSELNIHSDSRHSKLTDSPLLLESDQVLVLPERPIPQPVPKLVREELEPNSELQLSKEDAAREFGFLRQRKAF